MGRVHDAYSFVCHVVWHHFMDGEVYRPTLNGSPPELVRIPRLRGEFPAFSRQLRPSLPSSLAMAFGTVHTGDGGLTRSHPACNFTFAEPGRRASLDQLWYQPRLGLQCVVLLSRLEVVVPPLSEFVEGNGRGSSSFILDNAVHTTGLLARELDLHRAPRSRPLGASLFVRVPGVPAREEAVRCRSEHLVRCGPGCFGHCASDWARGQCLAAIL